MQRLPFVDWTRGFAVLAMVLWHSADAWLRPALKTGEGFFFVRFVGGLAAPAFLLLAGTGAALAARAPRDAAHAAQLRLAGLARGFEILLLGYALRLQTWLLDAAAVRQLHTVRAWLPLAAGYAALFWAARVVTRARRRALAWAAPGAALVAVGLLQVESVAPGRLARLLQVDVLQAIGAALMLLAWAAPLVRRPLPALATGVAIAFATPFVWAQLPGALPRPLAAYLGRFEPLPGAPAPALFPLFPWLAYACLGAALGSWLREVRTAAASSTAGAPQHRQGERAVDALVLRWMLLGALTAALTSEAHPVVLRVMNALPESVPPLRVAFRVGMITTLLGVGLMLATRRASVALLDLGRASLRVYWFHLPFAYGLLGLPLRGKLTYFQYALVAPVLALAMWGLSRVSFTRKRSSPERPIAGGAALENRA
jgi:uncharacterized membrane protein